jgi:flagellar protein FlbD
MISVTRLDGSPMLLNCDQIAWVERMPDTVISLMNGEKLIVRETPDALVERIQDFRRAVLSAPRRLAARATPGLTLAVSSERRS